MAGIPDSKTQRLGRFPAGLNNTADATAVPAEALREAVNVTLDDAGRARRREGHVVLFPEPCHSLFATQEHLFAVRAGALCAFEEDGQGLRQVATIRAGLAPRFVSLTGDDHDVYWSNGVESGRIDAELNDLPLWIANPDPPETAVVADGALAAGSYDLYLTALDAHGRESGASDPVTVAVAAGQGVMLTRRTLPADAVAWRVYATAADADQDDPAHLVQELTAADTTAFVGNGPRGSTLKTAWMAPLPPCRTLRYGHGRLVGLTEDGMVWSESYRLGLMGPESALGLFRGGTLLEPVGEGGDGAGWYVADGKRTYFFAGADPKGWRQVARYPHPAVPGSSLTVPGTVFGFETEELVACWMAANGVFCVGLPGGKIVPLREDALALPRDAERASAAYLPFEGAQRIVFSVLGGTHNGFAARDDADAEIRRNGVTL